MQWVSREIIEPELMLYYLHNVVTNNKNIRNKTKQNPVSTKIKIAQLLPYDIKVGIYH